MLNNPTYLNKAKFKSQLFQDQPEKPLKRAMWWIDYVLRNPDISHLKSRKLIELGFIEKHSIDVISAVAISIFVLTVGLIKFFLVICQFRRARRVQKEKKQ